MRNSLGQIIVNNLSSSLLNVELKSSNITLPTYKQYFLVNKEFTELRASVDKDFIIQDLTTRLAQTEINNKKLSIELINQDINSRMGCIVSVSSSVYAYPSVSEKIFNNISYNELIGFNDMTSPGNFNSLLSNGQYVYNIQEKQATIYKELSMARSYLISATLKYRFKYVGQTKISNITKINTIFSFWKYIVEESTSSRLGDLQFLTHELNNKDFNTNDVTETFEVSLLTYETLGFLTDKIYLPCKYDVFQSNGIEDEGVSPNVVQDKGFILEILPGSTFSLLPN